MTISVNGYDHQNYPQRNLKANNPSFGMAYIHKSVAPKVEKARKATPEVQETVQKLSRNIRGSELPYVLTSTFLGAYYLKNKETDAKVKVIAPSKIQGTTIEDTLSDADKKLMIMEVWGTEDDEIVQKLAKYERLCQNLETIKEMQKGEYAEIVNDLVNKSVRDSYVGHCSRIALSYLTNENAFVVPLMMPYVKRGKACAFSYIMPAITKENKEAVLRVFKDAQGTSDLLCLEGIIGKPTRLMSTLWKYLDSEDNCSLDGVLDALIPLGFTRFV